MPADICIMCASLSAGGTMRSIAGRIILLAVAVALILTWYAHRGQSVVAAQQRTPLTATRMFTGADGLSHVEQVDVKFSPVAGAPTNAEQSEPVKASKSYIVRLAPGFFEDWHNADARRYVLVISGRAEIEVAGGQKVFGGARTNLYRRRLDGQRPYLPRGGHGQLCSAIRRLRPVAEMDRHLR